MLECCWYMKKFLMILFCLVFAAAAGTALAVYVTPLPPPRPEVSAAPQTEAWSSVLLDADTGEILAEHDGEKRINPASTTKILTCIIALEEGKAKLNQNAVITPLAMQADGTKLGIYPEEPLSLHELLYGMMLISGNDAAVAAAETVGGTEKHFVDMMNEKAASIGVTHSHFNNPNGLTDPDHYSTAADMAKIAMYAMRNPEFRKIVAQTRHSLIYRSGMIRIVENRNEFLSSGYRGADGIKTGMTEAAGDCLIASAKRDGHLLIAVFYHDENRWKEAPQWLDYGFNLLQQRSDYEAALAAEPRFYRLVNTCTGRE